MLPHWTKKIVWSAQTVPNGGGTHAAHIDSLGVVSVDCDWKGQQPSKTNKVTASSVTNTPTVSQFSNEADNRERGSEIFEAAFANHHDERSDGQRASGLTIQPCQRLTR